MTRSLYYPILVLLVCACNNKEAGFDKSSVHSEVHSMLEAYHTDIAEKGLMAEFDYLDNSADFFWNPPGFNTTLSYDSVRTILENNSAFIAKMECTWDVLEIHPLSSSIASFSGIVICITTDTSGQVSRSKMIESGITVKRNDGWKLLNGQTTLLE